MEDRMPSAVISRPLLAALVASLAFALPAATASADHGHPVPVGDDWIVPEHEEGAGGAPAEEVDPWGDAEEWTDETVDLQVDDAIDPGATRAPDAPAKPKAGTPARTTTIRAAKVPYGALIAATARRNGVSVALFTALVWQESGFRATARSPVGARGLTQLMPATARSLGVRKVYDPAQNLAGGARYLRAQLIRFRSKRLALAAYNAGPGAVARFKGVPPYAETRNYVTRILALEARLRRAGVR